jgi:L-aminopeptidase/D-esterase-like protein
LYRPGPRNLITDVPGVRVGNATDETVRSGVTVVLCPGGWRAGVDVRGGGPGVRESDALAPENGYAKAHGLVLSGGSVFGLGAADASPRPCRRLARASPSGPARPRADRAGRGAL